MKAIARLIPALLVAALAMSTPHQLDRKRPARQWWDSHVDAMSVGRESN
jgi:hypothetical protein